MSQAREANLKASQLDHINNLLEESKGKMGALRWRCAQPFGRRPCIALVVFAHTTKPHL